MSFSLTFWQNIISPHQAPFIRELAALDHDVTIVASEAMMPDRAALGWRVPDLGRARLVIAPSPDQIQQLVSCSPRDSVHIMAGARWTSLGTMALQRCLMFNRRVGIMSEAPDPRGPLSTVRWAKYTAERFAKGRHYDFILAMGELGIRWFHRCGYPRMKLFPFTYVTEVCGSEPARASGSKFSILYAGRFIPLKALDLLLAAFAAATPNGARLRLLGHGPEKPRLEKYSRRLGIQDQVTWMPQTDASGVQAEMGAADVTVLPSHKDGWGAVVNESLMVGTPVICSTACGAADLVREPWLGTTFRAGSVVELTQALCHWIALGSRTPAERDRIRAWSTCISGKVVARYLVAVLEHVYSVSTRPSPPWRRQWLDSEL